MGNGLKGGRQVGAIHIIHMRVGGLWTSTEAWFDFQKHLEGRISKTIHGWLNEGSEREGNLPVRIVKLSQLIHMTSMSTASLIP